MIEIDPRHRQTIEQQAKAIFESGTVLWVYGSRVKGKSTPGSDLDMMVEFPECDSEHEQEVNLHKLLSFERTLQNTTIPFSIDVYAQQFVPQSIVDDIMNSRQQLSVV